MEKVALVTGASSGMGLEWCRQLNAKGYTVILTARSLEKASIAAQKISQTQDIVPKSLDIAAEPEIANLSKWVEMHYGKIDLIINNAGINPKDFSDPDRKAKAFELDKLDAEVMWDVLKVNSIAPLLIVKHFRSLLNKSERPIVLNISSWLGSVTNLKFGGHYGYIGSKNLLNVLNKSMANEIKAEGIISINVNPGWVKTDMGGARAEFTSEQAVNNMFLNIIKKVTINDSGSFLNFDGSIHPW